MASAPASVSRTELRLPDLLRRHYLARCLNAERWTVFQSEPNIKTVGLPLYKAASLEAYCEFLQRGRHYFLREYRVLYAYMAAAVSSATERPAFITDRFAPPGFHVIESSENRPFWGGTWHRDEFGHNFKELSGPTITGTLLLNEEIGVHGIEFWAGTADDARYEIFYHEPGRITLFNGRATHRIAMMPPGEEVLRRVTMQFHAVERPRGLELFW